MDKLLITGPNTLSGEVSVSSSKNAALPILAATILFPQEIIFNNLPGLSDINFFLQILESLGATSSGSLDRKTVSTKSIENVRADYDLVRKMRASVLVLGPLLSRFGKAEVSLPGGCAIGTRPVDLHLKGLEKMGAQIDIDRGYIKATCTRLKGTKIHLDFPSVGATENLMMAAVWADGETIIENAAKEPEIEDLANFLNQFGSEITGAGSSSIKIKGKSIDEFKPTKENEYRIIGDRIEAATYIIAGLMTNSEMVVKDFEPMHLENVLDILKSMGASLEISEKSVKTKPSGRLKGVKVETAPYPGFPTDVQAQLMSLMGISSGISVINENIFENRFMHVPELARLGMDVELDGGRAVVNGVEELSSAPVMCTDLRASAALVLAALVAEGTTEVGRIYHLDRGYERLAEKLEKLGANIKRVRG